MKDEDIRLCCRPMSEDSEKKMCQILYCNHMGLVNSKNGSM